MRFLKTNNLSVNKTPQRYLFHSPRQQQLNEQQQKHSFLKCISASYFYFKVFPLFLGNPTAIQQKNIYSFFQLISSCRETFLEGLRCQGMEKWTYIVHITLSKPWQISHPWDIIFLCVVFYLLDALLFIVYRLFCLSSFSFFFYPSSPLSKKN